MSKTTLIRAIAATALAVASAAAFATPRTVGANVAYEYNGSFFSFTGSGTLTFSQDVLDAFSLAQISFSNIAPAAFDAATGSASAALTTITLDDPSGAFLGLTTQGGLKMTAAKSTVSNGGDITIQNLSFDMNSKLVYADISGANGLASQTHYELFTVGGVVGDTAWNGTVGTFGAVGAPLTMTLATKALFIQALGLKSIGVTTLNAISDFGSSTVSITAVGAVPEPSTYALMGLGLGVAGWAARRRKA